MTEVVCKQLQVIRVEVVVVPENVIVTRSRGSLDSFVRHEVEVSFRGMVDSLVNHGSSQCIAILVLVGVCREESKESQN